MINNYIQFEKAFISTSGSFHILYLNNASEQLCNEIDFENEIVSNPTWNKKNFNDSLTSDEITNSSKYIEALNNEAANGLLQNLECKAISVMKVRTINCLALDLLIGTISLVELVFMQ